jgi:hypothetical protein
MENQCREILKLHRKSPSLNSGTYQTSNLFGMHIFDEQQVTLAMSEKEPLPSLWTNNVHVVKLAEAHFENMWDNAQTS